MLLGGGSMNKTPIGFRVEDELASLREEKARLRAQLEQPDAEIAKLRASLRRTAFTDFDHPMC